MDENKKKIPIMGEFGSVTTEGILADSKQIRYKSKTVEEAIEGLGDGVVVDTENLLIKVKDNQNNTYVAHVELLEKPAVPSYSGATTFTTPDNQKSISLTNNTNGATVVYTMTTDGSEPADPRTAQTYFVGPSVSLTGILSSISKVFKIKAAAKKNGEYSATILSLEITTYRQVQTPVISIVAGTNKFSTTRYVTISCNTDSATIHYTDTANGTPATAESPTYSGQFQETSSVKVNAIAVKSGWANSAAATEVFVEVGAPLIYYGVSTKTAMATMADITSLPYNVCEDTATGSYDIQSSFNGYIWFCVPDTMTINKVKASGFNVPMDAPTTTVSGYKCYRSSAEQKPVSDTFVVS
jgi:hypothetical protein